MSCTNRDASTITKRNRDVALYAWKNQQTTYVNAGNTSVLAEQPTYQTRLVITERNLGCDACAQVTATATSVVINYPFNGSGGGGPTGGAFPGQ